MKVVDSKSTFIDFYDQLDPSEKQPVVRLCNSRSVTRPNLYCERYLTLRYVRLIFFFFIFFFLLGYQCMMLLDLHNFEMKRHDATI